MNILSQRDPRWAGTEIAKSGLTLGTHGCLITALAMPAGLTPPDLMRRIQFDGAKVKWTSIERGVPNLRFHWRSTTYSASAVASAMQQFGFCLIEVDFDNVDATRDNHWVIGYADGTIDDPWTGTRRNISEYPKRRGYAIIEKLDQEDDLNADQVRTVVRSELENFKQDVINAATSNAINHIINQAFVPFARDTRRRLNFLEGRYVKHTGNGREVGMYTKHDVLMRVYKGDRAEIEYEDDGWRKWDDVKRGKAWIP
jgi:hypothetical protein